MKISELLENLKKKTVAKEELAKLLKCGSGERALFEAVRECGDLLQPVKSSGHNGNHQYPVYAKYRIVLPHDDYSYERERIRGLYPSLLKNGVLEKQPQKYRRYEEKLQRLSNYLFKSRLRAEEKISRRERSFVIFGDEKALDDKSFFSFLNSLGLGGEALAFYDTPEYCFCDYIPVRKAEMQILICENKDIWFNARRLMFEEGAESFFGQRFDGVLFGGGNKICEDENGSFAVYTEFLRAERVRYFYWGDIDREGFKIYLRLRDKYAGEAYLRRFTLELFYPAYLRMLELAEGLELPFSGDHREYSLPDSLRALEGFAKERRKELINILSENRRLPQEIVSYAVLKGEVD